ncbi:MAG: metal ABC transporter permease [Pirellulaceae bacterium]
MSASTLSPTKQAQPTASRTKSVSSTSGLSPDWLLPAVYFLVLLLIAVIWFRFLEFSPKDTPKTLGIIGIGILCSGCCSLLGCYLVLRRMSLIGDAISHAVLPGIAIAFYFTGQPYGIGIMLGAMALGMLTSFLTQSLHSLGKVSEDASMGVVFTSLFALGVILIQLWGPRAHLDADCVLYGDILYTWDRRVLLFGQYVPRALLAIVPAAVLTVGFIALLWKELKIVSFDPALAAAMGIKVWLVHYLLMGMVAGVTVASFESVGSILVVAMLIVPAATASLLTDRLREMLVWSLVIATHSAIFGYLSATALNTSVAGMMAVVAGVQFGGAVLLAPRHGLLSRWLRNLGLSIRIASEDTIGQLYRAEEAAALPVDSKLATTREAILPKGLIGWLSALSLRRKGLVSTSSSGSTQLTGQGRTAARNIVRAHRLWESFLEANFDLPPDHLHEPAERMEHFLDPDLQQQLDQQLAGRQIDPHGKVIPQGDGVP